MIQMSSSVAPTTGILGLGIMDRRPDNPTGNWNHVFILYCSSDRWVGVSRDVMLHTELQGPSDYRIHFLGAKIMGAVLDTLRRDGVAGLIHTQGETPIAMPNLDNAETVVLAGGSAGGSGVAWAVA